MNKQAEITENKKEKRKENNFEFSLSINGNKIISRYFSADDYNPKIRYTVDIRNMVDDIVDQIKETLKERDVDYMWEQYDLRKGSKYNSQDND